MTIKPFLCPGLLASLAVLVMASACARNPPAQAPSSSASLMDKIRAEVGDAACEGPQDCRSIAIGAKPCGGPDGYLAWSARRSDAVRLRALVDQYAAARKDENQRAGANSTCVFETNPGVTCLQARCTLRARGQGSVPDNDA
ncbi:hypothetical protein [Massilia yuzhufengensis]|uniref:DUF4189 domain-containing protein n=1 Tax=Massilia yuzhufengensis TaxID=1164594 RepID=A0A1I1PAK2_9BURK|nr:hypothetical protein [Massilia yuzhufengensis]SFD06924.1 hypothetical protein SAMN05216204_11575 [Massilia yuzhufengensis]